MPNTYTQIHIQFVFAVKNRKAVIHVSWKEELYRLCFQYRPIKLFYFQTISALYNNQLD